MKHFPYITGAQEEGSFSVIRRPAQAPQRTVEAVMAEGIGEVSAQDLLAMPEDESGLLRDQITDQ